MKKILYIATIDQHIRHFHLPILKELKKKGYETHVASNGKEEFLVDKKININFERNPFKINNIKAIFQLRKILLKEKYDILHCHTPVGAMSTRIAAIGTSSEVIYTAHGFHFFKGASLINWLVYYPIEKLLSKFTDKMITINEEDFDLAKNKFYAKKITM